MIVVQHLTKSFGNFTAVNDLSLEIREGEALGFLGPNGAGKTTTFNIIAGLMLPHSGRIQIGEYGSPQSSKTRALLGLAPQALALYDNLTGEENLSFFGKIQGLHGTRLKERVQSSLKFVGLYDRRSDRAKTYSGGMKRRLNLAAALVHEPKFLLLDEPTVGVDPQSRNAILDRIKELRSQGLTIVYSTHYMEEAQSLCDRVAIIDHGKLLDIGTVDELITRYCGAPIVKVTLTNGDSKNITSENPFEELTHLKTQGVLRDFRLERGNLETVFLALTGKSLRDE